MVFLRINKKKRERDYLHFCKSQITYIYIYNYFYPFALFSISHKFVFSFLKLLKSIILIKTIAGHNWLSVKNNIRLILPLIIDLCKKKKKENRAVIVKITTIIFIYIYGKYNISKNKIDIKPIISNGFFLFPLLITWKKLLIYHSIRK